MKEDVPYQRIVEDILNPELSTFNGYEKIINFLGFLSAHPVFVTMTHSGNPLFRTRINDCNKDFLTVSEIIHPKPELVKSFSRANRPYQSLFYCSDTEVTSYMELAQNMVDGGEKLITLTTSKWEVMQNIDAATIIKPYSKDRKNEFEQIRGKVFDEFIKDFNEGEKQYNIDIQYFFSTLFAKEAIDYNDYIKTSAIANYFFLHDNKLGIEGIIYPSVQFKKDEQRGFNYALYPHIYEQGKIQLISIFKRIFLVSGKEIKDVFFEKAKGFDVEKDTIEW